MFLLDFNRLERLYNAQKLLAWWFLTKIWSKNRIWWIVCEEWKENATGRRRKENWEGIRVLKLRTSETIRDFTKRAFKSHFAKSRFLHVPWRIQNVTSRIRNLFLGEFNTRLQVAYSVVYAELKTRHYEYAPSSRVLCLKLLELKTFGRAHVWTPVT